MFLHWDDFSKHANQAIISEGMEVRSSQTVIDTVQCSGIRSNYVVKVRSSMSHLSTNMGSAHALRRSIQSDAHETVAESIALFVI